MQKVGAPQPADLIKASQSDIKKNLISVNRTVLTMFKDVSMTLIEEFGAEEALERAIAYISGYTDKMTQRSLLCCLEGYITYIVRTTSEFRGPGYIWGWLKSNFPDEVTDRIKGMKKFLDSKGAVFDIAESDKELFDEYLANQDETKSLQLEIAVNLPELEEDAQTGGYQGNGYKSRSAGKEWGGGSQSVSAP
jgi:ATP-dependent RNA helicase DDX21